MASEPHTDPTVPPSDGDTVARPVVHVRLFAALADAAGTDRLTTSAGTVAQLRRELAERFGEPFTTRLSRSRAWVDGEDVDKDAPLPDGVEVALLPPFAGG